MTHNCPKCVPAVKVIWQPAKMRYWCPKCFLNFTPREVSLIEGGKS